jgi:carboxypeptidase Q
MALIETMGNHQFDRAVGRFAATVIVGLVLTSSSLGVLAPQENVDRDAVNRIKKEAFESSRLRDVLSYITDVTGARLTGSPGIRQAQKWIVGELGEYGLANPHLEPWGPFGRGWSLEGFVANMTKPGFNPLIAYPKAWSPSTQGAIRGEPIYLDAKDEAGLQLYRGKLRGRIVLIAPPREVRAHFEPDARRLSDEQLLRLANAAPSAQRFELSPEQRAAQELLAKKWRLVYSEGAAIALQPGSGDGGTLWVTSATIPAPIGTPYDKAPKPWAPDSGPVIPQAVVALEHYNRIIRLLREGVRVELQIEINSRFYSEPGRAGGLMEHNVIAELPGADLKDEIVMIGGCLDSWHAGTGATDNAAGAAICIEAMRVLKALDLHPRRTIRLGLWSGEEQGRLGSRAYVAEHFARRIEPVAGSSPVETAPRFEMRAEYNKLSVYFDLDDGTGRIRGVYLRGNEVARPIFRSWLADFKDLGASTLTSTSFDLADDFSFAEVGLPGFFFLRDEIDYGRIAHTNMDVYDRIQEDDLKQAVAVVASFAYNAAMRDEKLPRMVQATQ